MSTINGLIKGIEDKNRLLTQKSEEYSGLCEKAAAAKRDYRVALAKKFLDLKYDGNPATLIPVLARGDKHVAECKFKQDVAEGVVSACSKAISDLRTAIDSYRSILCQETKQNVNVYPS